MNGYPFQRRRITGQAHAPVAFRIFHRRPVTGAAGLRAHLTARAGNVSISFGLPHLIRKPRAMALCNEPGRAVRHCNGFAPCIIHDRFLWQTMPTILFLPALILPFETAATASGSPSGIQSQLVSKEHLGQLSAVTTIIRMLNLPCCTVETMIPAHKDMGG